MISARLADILERFDGARSPRSSVIIAQGHKIIRRLRRRGFHEATFHATFGEHGWRLVVWQGEPPDWSDRELSDEEGRDCTCIVRNDPMIATTAIVNCPFHGYDTEART